MCIFFKAMHKEKERERLLLEPLDNDDNTIAHLAAETGNTTIFKVEQKFYFLSLCVQLSVLCMMQ